jgi:hypothetical protein
VAGPDQTLECEGDLSTWVVLDAAASWDPDSTSGSNDDIISYAWSENDEQIATGSEAATSLYLGSHALVLNVVDRGGLGGSDAVEVTVHDTLPPELVCPASVEVECDLAGHAHVPAFSADAWDSCDPDVEITNSFTEGGADASGSYPLGETTVGFVAADLVGNTDDCETTVVVVDTQAPIAALTATPDTVWPPNHKMVTVTIDVAAEDDCSTSDCHITGVSSNEPIDASDYSIVADDQFEVRAERSSAEGRVYTATVICEDASGNTSAHSVSVTVPHDNGKG